MITQVSVRNYKSLANVEVDLNPLTVLVGPNGSGKSNFVDALRFVSDAVTVGLDQAVSERNGIDAIKYAVSEDQNGEISFDIRFQFGEDPGEFRFAISIGENGGYRVRHEEATAAGRGYEVKDGGITFAGSEADIYSSVSQALNELFNRSNADIDSAIIQTILNDLRSRSETHAVFRLIDQKSLFLPLFSTFFTIREIQRYLRNAGYYAIFPGTLRELQLPDSRDKLVGSGENLNSVLQRLKEDPDPEELFDRLKVALGKMVPGIVDILVVEIGWYLAAKLEYRYGDRTQDFYLAQESDGTLRLLGILTALYQQPAPSLITIEEPELAVHPGALQTLYEVIKEASQRSQIIITTHSPDLIALCDPDDLRIVEKDESGATRIGRLDKNQLAVIQEMLFKSSDLLRIEGLHPESSAE